MCKDLINFPELINLMDYAGNYDNYEAELLRVYNADLWNSGLQFAGLNVVPRVHKKFESNGKTLDWTFVHFTSSGSVDEDRELDLRRCERIGYVKRIIENANLDCVKVYENSRLDKNNKLVKSVVLWCECVNSKVVLTKKQGKQSEYYVVTTFYLINSPHKIKNHNEEYEAYVAANGEFDLS
jgi:hypothetical protein